MSVDLLPFPSDTRIKPSNWSRSPSSLASLPEIFGKVNKPEPSNQFLVSRVIIQITSPREKISVSRDKIVVSWSLAKNILLKEEPSSRICKRYRSDSEKERERERERLKLNSCDGRFFVQKWLQCRRQCVDSLASRVHLPYLLQERGRGSGATFSFGLNLEKGRGIRSTGTSDQRSPPPSLNPSAPTRNCRPLIRDQ